jgi:predicted amidophosphoribosyltransferase
MSGVRVYSPFLTCDALLSLVRFLKFECGTASVKWLGAAMADAYLSDPAGLSRPLLVPVPLHWRRRAGRGYDQASLLAREVSTVTGVSLAARALARTRRTKAQSSLDEGEKALNVDGAFRLRDAGRIRDMDVILVDDLVTSGRTAEACCRALLGGNPASLSVLSAGRRGEGKNRVEGADCHMFE